MIFEIIVCYKDHTWEKVKRNHPDHVSNNDVLESFLDESINNQKIKKDENKELIYIDVLDSYPEDEDE